MVTVVVSSCDSFSDCWAPFFHGIHKYWPDCPYPIHLITNHKEFHAPQCTTVQVGKDQGWSANLMQVLDQIHSRHVLYFQEDYWIMERVDGDRIAQYAALMDQHGLNYVRLLAAPPPDAEWPHDPRLGVLAPNADYRGSLQAALWRKDVLRELLDPSESPWDFEIKGNQRTRRYGTTFLSVKNRGRDRSCHGIRYTYTAIWKGRWARCAHRYARREGLSIDFSRRESEWWWHDFRRSGPVGEFVGTWVYRAGALLSDPRKAGTKIRQHLAARK